MRTLRLPPYLLILPLCLPACTSTGVVSPKLKTVASVGDKPLPVVTGEPGDSVRAEHVSPDPIRRLGSRISGRVVDENGEPAANVDVRLAVGNTAGGKVVRATTDRTGAFTLKGVRPGSTYTVIAEDEKSHLAGRCDAQAPDADVRITLVSDEATTKGAVGSSAPRRINHVSERQAAEDEEEPGAGRAPAIKINEEDLPPAPEAESLAPPEDGEPRAASATRRLTSTRTAGWRGMTNGPSASHAKSDPGAAPIDPETHGTAGKLESATPPEEEDEGPNPLPPALEPGQAAAASRPPRPGPEAATTVAATEPSPSPFAEAAAFAFGPEPAIENVKPQSETEPSALAGPVLPAAAEPTHPPTTAGVPPAAPESLAEGGPAPLLEPTESTRKRPTWRELTATAGSAPISREGTSLAMLTPAVRPSRRPSGIDPPQTVPRAGPPRADDGKSFCDFDPKYRRIRDFRLPNLEGRPVRFQELDADLVLLDFFGTWCQPCLKSIPHLVDLQKRMGDTKFKVVGIACEEGAPEKVASGVAKEVRRLGINYPVLLSPLGERCPLQEALHIQAFPTMILVDRQGRIVWRDQGATPQTIARLDRFIASASKPDVRRY